uniref:HET domain-containing protein n=1 Tax=Heterorhabditis bacteriophora TaxID=37862 RepID=A0A1I7WX72_HETBA
MYNDKSWESRFDYNILIPKGLDERSRGMVEMFLRNEQMTDDLREEALQVFAQALMCEPGGTKEIKTTGECSESETATSSLSKEDALFSKESKNGMYFRLFTYVGVKSNISLFRMANLNLTPNVYQKIDSVLMKIAVYSQRLGCQMYNFITYPIGGVKRGFWEPSCSSYIPPPIDLPDLQLQNHLWETYVNGQISTWIDCDSEDEQLATLSEKELVKELNYLSYMGLRSVVIRLRRADSPRLARVLNHWMWTKNVNIGLWVFVPTSLDGLIRFADDPRDCWSIWADFRSLCSNFSSQKLIAGLHLTSDIDDEFIEHKLIVRWKAEPSSYHILFINIEFKNISIAPIMSLHMHQTIKSSGASYWNSGIPGHGKNGTVEQEDGTYKQSYPQGQQIANLDQIYVVFLRQYCSLDESKPVFTFVHPNFLQKSNERSSAIEFKMDRTADLMGFAGYFHMSLYKDIALSIVPSTYSKGMISWFPALIPLRKLHRVKDGDNVSFKLHYRIYTHHNFVHLVIQPIQITFLIDRKVDNNGVWYEWRLEYTGCDGMRQRTVLQNKDGESYYMKLL